MARPARREITIPKRWVKVWVALFLLPAAWVLTQTFFGALAWATLEKDFWRTQECAIFLLGATAWLFLFVTMPKPLRVYVFGHELTHALTVWLMGGKVYNFEVRRDGGHILTDKVNTWVALAPYFIPLYSVLVLIVYLLIGLFADTTPFYPWMLGALGFTWAFHLSFTCWMIPQGQSDLTYGGHFFSLLVIYLANLLLLSALLIVASPAITPGLFAEELFHNTQHLWEMADGLLRSLPL